MYENIWHKKYNIICMVSCLKEDVSWENVLLLFDVFIKS